MITAACQMSDSLARSVRSAKYVLIPINRSYQVRRTPRSSRVTRRVRTSRSSTADPHLVNPCGGLF